MADSTYSGRIKIPNRINTIKHALAFILIKNYIGIIQDKL